MTKGILAALMAAILAGNCIGQNQPSGRLSLPDQVRAIRTGHPVEVCFNDGSKLRGRIGEISETGFVLSHENKRQVTNSQVAFNELRSVKQVKTVKPSHAVRNVLIGVGIAGAVIGAMFGIYVATHGLG